MLRRSRSQIMVSLVLLGFLLSSTMYTRSAHAQWYVTAVKVLAGTAGFVIALWEGTSEACALYENNTNEPSGSALGACRRAGANKNDLSAQLKALRALPKQNGNVALQNFCNTISESDRNVLMTELTESERRVCVSPR